MNLVILDRDGTLIKEPPDKQIDSLGKLEFVPGVITGLNVLTNAGYTLVTVSNQDGLGSKSYSADSYNAVQEKIIALFKGEGIQFDDIFVCPHFLSDNCECRKPKTGLIDDYIAINKPDPNNSFVVGDRETDVQFGKALGFRSILLSDKENFEADFTSDRFQDICNYIVDSSRSSTIERITNETKISVQVKLNGTGESRISTGIGFFDHMLEQIAKHSGIEMNIVTNGDNFIDEHHSVEDTGIALGEAISGAIGDKRGIERYAFALPMDEASAHVLLDLSGRSYLKFEAEFNREKVGELPTELVEDFFRSFSDALKCNLHIKVSGRNDHHKIESIFKTVGRTLKEAVRVDIDRISEIPSTKGTI